MSGLDDTLSRKTLDQSLLEVLGVSVGVDLVGDDLDSLDGFLREGEEREEVSCVKGDGHERRRDEPSRAAQRRG